MHPLAQMQFLRSRIHISCKHWRSFASLRSLGLPRDNMWPQTVRNVLHGSGFHYKPRGLLKDYKHHISHHNSLWSVHTHEASQRIWDSIVSIGRCQRFISSAKHPEGAHPASYPMGNGVFFICRESGWGVRLTTNFYLVPRLRMRGATPTLPLYTLMACTERTSPLPNSPLPNTEWKNVVLYR